MSQFFDHENDTSLLQQPKTETPIQLIDFDQRYLPSDLRFRIPNTGIIAIKSPKGTGKTVLLKHVVNDCNKRKESVLLLGHRVFLLKDLAVRSNLAYYLDLDNGEIADRLALCLNSLTRINPTVDEPYHTLILDESEQVFQALLSEPLEYNLSKVFNILCWLFAKAKRIIVLDADLSSDLTIEMVADLREINDDEDFPICAIRNSYRIGDGKTTRLYASKEHLLAEVVRALGVGEKAFVACNSRRFATHLDAIVRALGKSTLLVTAETTDLQATKAFIANPSDESSKYDAVIASPTLSTGVSIEKPKATKKPHNIDSFGVLTIEQPIEKPHFTKVFGFFTVKPGTFQDIDQALSRVRYCDDVSVWIQETKKSPDIPTREVLYSRAIAKELGTIKRLYSEPALLTEGQKLWARIYSRIAYLTELWSARKDTQFIELRKTLGFNIDHIPPSRSAISIGRDLMNNTKAPVQDRALDIFMAADLQSEEEIENIQRKRGRSRAEYLALRKHRLKESLGKKFNLDNVRKALDQDLNASIRKIDILHNMTDDMRRDLDTEERKEGRTKTKDTFTTNQHRTKQHELLRSLCKAGDINIKALYSGVRADKEIEITRSCLEVVAKEYERRKTEFNFYFDSAIRKPTEAANLMKVWNATIGNALSLPLMKRKLGTKGRRENHYFIDNAAKDLVLKMSARLPDLIAAMREKKRKAIPRVGAPGRTTRRRARPHSGKG